MSKEHDAYEVGYRDGSINYELEHCPACKNVADPQEALEENAKLRAERDYLLMNSNPTATELRRVRREWKNDRDENAKLRELATETIRLMQANGPDCGLCKHYDECWTGEAMDYSPSGCVICNEARELGIEVGE